MTTTTKTYELAVQQAHSVWEHCGDFATREEAIAEAIRLAAIIPGPGGYLPVVYRDDFGTAVFGISDDPDSGHYEDRVEVYEDGSYLIL